MPSFYSRLAVMAATSLFIIKGAGVCHLHQILASPRDPLEKASLVTVETSSFLDADSRRLRLSDPREALFKQERADSLMSSFAVQIPTQFPVVEVINSIMNVSLF